MKKVLKRIALLILFLTLLISIKSYAAEVSVTGKQEHRQDAYLTVSSSETISNIKIYKQIDENRYILFYRSSPRTNSSVCRISSTLLSDEKETQFKVVVEHENGEVIVVDTTIDKIEAVTSMNPEETAKPSWSPSPLPTKPTPSPSPSQSTTPSESATSTVDESASPSESSEPEESGESTESAQPSTSTKASEGEHTYSQTGSKISSYKDESISVTVEKIGNFYVTKVWLKDPSQQMKKASADWGKQLKTVNNMLNGKKGAIVGCNGSGFFLKGAWEPGSKSPIRSTAWNKTTEGYLVITGGKILRQLEGQKTNALLGILPGGGFKYYESNAYSDVTGDGVQDTYTFGPMLVYEGKAYKQNTGSPRFSNMTAKAYRCCVGQVDSNNFIILSTKNQSSLNECASMGLKLDCNMLYNMDGGGSTTLWFRAGTSGNGKQIRETKRAVGDALYFTSLK